MGDGKGEIFRVKRDRDEGMGGGQRRRRGELREDRGGGQKETERKKKGENYGLKVQ